MAGAFETATKAAIEELIMARSQASKFGYILSEEGFKDLTSDLYELLVTSRSLKAAGDRFLRAGAAAAPQVSERVGAETAKAAAMARSNRGTSFFKKRS